MLRISAELRKHFKGYCSSPEVIMLFVYMKCRFSLSYRDLEEMMQIGDRWVDLSTLQRWVRRFTCLINKRVQKRKRPVSGSWRMDETYVRVNGKWVYLYRAVDKYGDTIHFLLRARRDATAAKAFFTKAFRDNGIPEKVTIDKSGANIKALEGINNNLPKTERYEIRQKKYLNNIVEQDHRFIKKRIKPMLGFKNFHSAAATLNGIEAVRMIQKGQIQGQHKNQSAFKHFSNWGILRET